MGKTVSLGSKQYALIGLVVVTAVIHLFLGVDFGDALFILNGVGYLALIAGYYFVPKLASQRGLIRMVLMGFTAITIVLYFFLTPDIWSPFGLITKAVEVGIIALLAMEKA